MGHVGELFVPCDCEELEFDIALAIYLGQLICDGEMEALIEVGGDLGDSWLSVTN